MQEEAHVEQKPVEQKPVSPKKKTKRGSKDKMVVMIDHKNGKDDEHNAATTPRKMKVRRGSKEQMVPIQQNESKDEMEDNEKEVVFQPPAEGTPAAQALQANADIKVTRLEKGIRRIKGIKHPKAKNITKFMKRKKNKKRAFSRNFKGKVIDGVHELYTITAGMMLGLRCAVGRSNTSCEDDLLIGDFSYVEKISFPPHGNNQPPFRTPPHQLAHTFKFKTYAPLVFSKLRDFFGVDSLGYMLSVCGNYNYLEFISNSKSGQFFFYSHDGRYMIKTQTNEENKFMKRILPHYYRYVTENPHTFLVRIYGMHRVKMYHLNRKTHFVIMQSVFDTPEPIQTIYDLKGSLVGRNASKKERESGGVLKDNDLIDDGVKLQLGSKRQDIIDQLEKDANFLAEMNIMDYSVLLGIHDRTTRHSSEVEPSQLPSHASMSNMAGKRRSVVPFRLNDVNDVSGSSMGESNQDNSSSTRLKKRTSSLDSHFKKSSTNVTKHTTNVDHPDVPHSSDTHSDEDDDYVSSENEVSGDEDEDDYYYDDDDDEHFDAGDSDRSMCNTDFDTTEVPSDLPNRFDDTLLTNLNDNAEGDDDIVKKNAGLTGVNLNAFGKKPGVGKGTSLDASSIHSSSMYATVGSTTVGSHSDNDGDVDDDVDDDHDVGIGLAGEEGKAISKMFKDNVDLSVVASDGIRISMGRNGPSPIITANMDPPAFSRNITFGPGSTRRHPWTGRYDGGINCRLPDGSRGNYVYYIGVIDILQQYNASKRIETIFKGLTHDKAQISSVDSVSYAKRFVQFMKDNTV